ncbi:hypothetical protein CTAYLR_009097 [Chrysophaeum taylorii]|uniref:WW domain-containing protein n=1 Tax=Chrysophaeum taylorii TaxID=2483200 RepID=A0AAD7UIB2_9STRA|nr:hypothetical protein CTAYLR_009097 [Chrysophaeum taylorii]
MLKNLRRLSTGFGGGGGGGKAAKSGAVSFEEKAKEEQASAEDEESKKFQPRRQERIWRTARDPKSGRIYYYDVVTRETQWTKPSELLDAKERAELERQEAEKKSFFEEMEANMKRRFAEGLTSVDMPKTTRGIGWRPPRPSSGSFSDSRYMVRTLSTMDDSYLRIAQSLARPSSTERRQRSLSPSGRRDSNAENIMPRIPEAGLPSKHRSSSDGPVKRLARNSTGTMFLDTTLEAPDKEATIRCVCHVVRAHIASTPKETWALRPDAGDFAVFHDADAKPDPPSARELVAFYRDVFSRGQMELECIVASLIYVERLLKAARGKFRLRPSNWRPVLLSCMIMASKVCDDLSMWNADFSHICRAFDLARINALEAALLKAYGFNATVSASEYAKYYFHLRSMAARLGLTGVENAQPLNVSAARAVAARSRRRFSKQELAAAAAAASEQATDAADLPHVRRAQSIGVERHIEANLSKYNAPKSRPAILEQVVDMHPTKESP